MPNKLS